MLNNYTVKIEDFKLSIFTKKRMAIAAIITLSAACVALFAALAMTSMAFERYRVETVNAVAEVEVVEEKLVELEEKTIDIDVFKEYSQQYSVSGEFLQRFFQDEIVYRTADGVVYAPIDETLPKSKLDFNNLVVEPDSIKYVENGVDTGIKGIDVSKHQGNIDWVKVKNDGVEFAIIRLGYRGYEVGNVLIDEKFHQNMRGAIAAGVKVGVYFYSQAITVQEALDEAAFVLENIKNYDITYPVVFDMEEVTEDTARMNGLTTAQRTDFTIAFCDEVEKAGYTPMIYGGIKWLVEMVDMSRLVKYDKWFAQFYKTPFFPYDLQMWQYTSSGKVDGIAGNVDINIGFKDYSAQ